ncbi:hypothetical protein [Moorella sulfitireducens (nom. illeg.)]|uniref:hypothetical protein n=1 Tax=Neomoorella sulfitireducens TaxID=2972948 RepID=UPI0021ACE711|nr:hypothetical protein [Moorella sulfitireducens]
MIIRTLNVLVLRCPSCGRLEYRGLSFFNFAGGRIWQVECSCGTPLLTVSRKKGKSFWLQYRCGMCDSVHIASYTRRELWSRELLTLTCKETELEVGFIGPREKVQRAVQYHNRAVDEAVRDLGFRDYFDETDIMYQLLSVIYHLAEEGRVTCGCGSENIEIEIFPGHLQLRCQACRAEKILPAATIIDLEQAEKLKEIRLPGHLASKNGNNTKQRDRRRRKSRL